MLYYFIGINGSGMYGLSNILKQMGCSVMGYDITIKDSEIAINKDYIYIISNAYIDNDKVRYLYDNNYNCYLYHEFIAKYFKDYRFICVSGSHGKTTTTKFLSRILDNYSFICGDKTSRLGAKTMILESCEYKRSFLSYTPDILIILSLDFDHPDYYIDEEDYINAYIELASKSKIVILNKDDKYAYKIKHDNLITFGFGETCDYVIDCEIEKGEMKVKINEHEFKLNHIGKHIAYDFCASLIVCNLEGLSINEIKDKLYSLSLPQRRLETVRVKDKTLISDYAHHPSEVKYLYESLSVLYDLNKLLLIFEPHTFTRFNAFKKDFKEQLSKFKNVVITRIYYPTREKRNIELEDELYKYMKLTIIEEENLKVLISQFDVIVFCGAGNINSLYVKWIEKLQI